MSKKKLFLIHNHKNFSGAARSLGETIICLKKKVDFIVICPKGTASKFFKSLNISVLETKLVPRFNHFEIGYYRGWRWILLLREFLAMFYFFFFLIYLKIKYNKINNFHLNEIELSIVSPLLRLFFDAKITSHLRSPLEIKRGRLRYKFLKKLCENYLEKIIAIDNDCFRTSPVKKNSIIIYNGINYRNINVKSKKNKIITFGFVGNFIKRKGIYEALEVFREMNGKFKANLLCVGKNKIQNKLLNLLRYEKNFEYYFSKNKIMKYKNIKILPMTFNLKNFYSNIDVILFPGYMNAVGRPVIEAALLKKPSIIALNNYNNDTAKKNNCLIFKPGDIISLKQKILYLLKNKSKIKKLGISAFKNAKKKFNIKRNSKKFDKVIWG